jgi:hypothetical protein
MDEIIDEFSKKLINDLSYSAPEMWETHIRRRMKELASAVEESHGDDN